MILEATDIKKQFGKLEVLKGVSLSMQEGEVVSIIGPSGSGKSTFVRCLNRLERINSGKIVIDGETLAETVDGTPVYPKEKEQRAICAKTGMVFQHFNLFPHLTALENIIEAPVTVRKMEKKAAIELGRELLAKVGLSDKEGNYPAMLSGGQKQRIAIARALALSPKIMLFDEPTSALDPEITNEVLNVIHDLAQQNMTMVIVTHEMNFARDVSDRVLFMDNGIIMEEGKPEEVFGNAKSERLADFLKNVRL